MNTLRPFVSVVTTLAFLAQTTGIAYAQNVPAAPDAQAVQPVPYAPSQPVPLPAAPPSPPGAVAPPFAPVPPAPTYLPPPAASPGYAPGYTPGYAAAPAAGRGAIGDTVFLKDGGLMRGTLIEMLPNDHVTIELPTGQTTVVEWGRIDHIERGSLAPPPVAARREPGFPRAPRHGRVPTGVEPTVTVHVEGDSGIVLQAVSPGSGRWAAVCAGPCDAAVPLDREYRISGEGIRPSRAFRIHAEPGQRVVLNVSTASRSAYSAGLALTSVGSATIVVGLVVLVFGAFAGPCQATDEFGDCLQTTGDSGVETAGGVIALVGAGILVAGIVIWASNLRTTESQTVTELMPKAPVRAETSWLRAPIWHDSVHEASGSAKAMGFPLFSRSF
jgi:hypothetical protein